MGTPSQSLGAEFEVMVLLCFLGFPGCFDWFERKGLSIKTFEKCIGSSVWH